MSQIITAAELAVVLGCDPSDAWLATLTAGANELARNYCSRDFERLSRVEYAEGFGLDYLFLRESPIHAVTEVRIDHTGVFDDTSIVADLSNFFWRADRDDNRLWCRGGFWPEGPRVAKVTYEAGYWMADDSDNTHVPPGPAALRSELITRTAAIFREGLETQGFESIRQGDVSYARWKTGASESFFMALEQFKRR